MNRDEWRLITISLNGAASASRLDCSGSGGTLASYLAQAAEGAWVVDVSACTDVRAAVRQSVSGPMPGYSDEVEPSPVDVNVNDPLHRAILGAFAEGGGGGAAHAAFIPGALDRVPLAQYAAGWRKAGARIGRVRKGVVEWE